MTNNCDLWTLEVTESAEFATYIAHCAWRLRLLQPLEPVACGRG